MHRPVMLKEVIEGLCIRRDGWYVDATLGGGGHASAILSELGPGGRLLGIDRDPSALERLKGFGEGCHAAVTLVCGNFGDLDTLARKAGLSRAHGILFDLGVSSFQLDQPERGFSFRADGPLDMRMDPAQPLTAETIVNEWSVERLADVLFRFGEETAARRISRAIGEERDRERIQTTGRLADLVERVKGGRRGRLHPATKTFMALRMAVNGELESIERGLAAAADLLAVGGRLAVLSFHSLEDRVVKQFVRRHIPRTAGRPEGGAVRLGEEPPLQWVGRKPRTPSEEERRDNPRARSAKLRVAEKTNHGE
jgi:16S rRNA (cytosine1402-N4)-methyltransferase